MLRSAATQSLRPARARAVDPSMSVKRKVTVPAASAMRLLSHRHRRAETAPNQPSNWRITMQALCPPKPNEFEIATFTSASRASFGM